MLRQSLFVCFVTLTTTLMLPGQAISQEKNSPTEPQSRQRHLAETHTEHKARLAGTWYIQANGAAGTLELKVAKDGTITGTMYNDEVTGSYDPKTNKVVLHRYALEQGERTVVQVFTGDYYQNEDVPEPTIFRISGTFVSKIPHRGRLDTEYHWIALNGKRMGSVPPTQFTEDPKDALEMLPASIPGMETQKAVRVNDRTRPGWIVYFYNASYNSGVQVYRTDTAMQRVYWKSTCKPVEENTIGLHRIYKGELDIINGEVILKMTSSNKETKTFEEHLDKETGKSISRIEKERALGL